MNLLARRMNALAHRALDLHENIVWAGRRVFLDRRPSPCLPPLSFAKLSEIFAQPFGQRRLGGSVVPQITVATTTKCRAATGPAGLRGGTPRAERTVRGGRVGGFRTLHWPPTQPRPGR